MGYKKTTIHINRIFFSLKETEQCLLVSRRSLLRLMKSGLPSHRIGKKIVFLKEDVAKWIEEH